MIVDFDAYVGTFWPGCELSDGRPEAVKTSLVALDVGAAFVALMEGPWYRNQQAGNEQLARMIKPFRDFFLPLACLDPTAKYSIDDLDHCVDRLGMVGVRLYPTYHHYLLDDPRVIALAREVGRRSLPVFVTLMIEEDRFAHPAVREMPLLGFPPDNPSVRPAEGTAIHIPPGLGDLPVPPLAALVAEAPETTFVVTMAQVEQAHSLLRDRVRCAGRVFFDIPRMDKPTLGLDHLIRADGSEQLVLGTHAPFQYPEGAVMNLAYRSFSRDVARAILKDNYRASPVLRAAVAKRAPLAAH